MRDTDQIKVLRCDNVSTSEFEDHIVVEEPLEVRVNNHSIGITMRTPGDDFDLAIGLLQTEGIVQLFEEVGTVAYCPDEQDAHLKNIVNVTLVDSARSIHMSRVRWATSSCGLCGEATLESIRK